MKSKNIWMGLVATLGMAIGVIVALAGLPYGRLNYTGFAAPGLAPPASVFVSVDCDTTTAGVQDTCNIPVPASGTRTVAIIATNNSGSPVTIGSFNFDVFEGSCGGATATSHVAATIATSGCTGSANAKGIFPNSSPNLSGASTGFTNLVLVANFQSSCPLNGAADIGDSGTGGPNTSTSAVSCNNSSGGETLANGASVILATVTFTVDVTAAGSVPLQLSNVGVGNDNGSTLVLCTPAADPPSDPGVVTGPCVAAALNFTAGGATATPTTAGATATPTNTVAATATNTVAATATNTVGATATNTVGATATNTVAATATNTVAATVTTTSVATATNTVVATATNTVAATATNTVVGGASATPVSATATPTAGTPTPATATATAGTPTPETSTPVATATTGSSGGSQATRTATRTTTPLATTTSQRPAATATTRPPSAPTSPSGGQLGAGQGPGSRPIGLPNTGRSAADHGGANLLVAVLVLSLMGAGALATALYREQRAKPLR